MNKILILLFYACLSLATLTFLGITFDIKTALIGLGIIIYSLYLLQEKPFKIIVSCINKIKDLVHSFSSTNETARKFNVYRFNKLIRTLIVSLTLSLILLTIFSHFYSGVYELYDKKIKFCNEKYQDEYLYVIQDCYNKELKIYRVWLDIKSESPKYTVAIIFIDLVALGLYTYLFPKFKENITKKRG